MIKKKRKILWKSILHMSLDKCHESQYKAKYNGREIAWVQITPLNKRGEFGRPKNYFMDLTKDPKTRTEHTTQAALLTDIDNELAIVKSIKKKK